MSTIKNDTEFLSAAEQIVRFEELADSFKAATPTVGKRALEDIVAYLIDELDKDIFDYLCNSTIDNIVAHLTSDNEYVVCAVLDALRRFESWGALGFLGTLVSNASPRVRIAALMYAAGVDLEFDIAYPLLIAALKDESYLVRETAIDELDEYNCVEAIEDIRPLLNDPHPDVVQAAEIAVLNLTGEKA